MKKILLQMFVISNFCLFSLDSIACSGTSVSSCSKYTSSATCSSSYYVAEPNYYKNQKNGNCTGPNGACNLAIYCIWSGSSCYDGGAQCSY
jgi:hypothetical protein